MKKALKRLMIISLMFWAGTFMYPHPLLASESDGALTFSGITSDSVQESGTVLDISSITRCLSLKISDNEAKSVCVGSDVENFEQIHIGDSVTYEQYRHVQATVLKGSNPSPIENYENGTSSVSFGNPAENIKHIQHDTIAVISDLDRYYRKVTFKAPNETLTVTVDADDADFGDVQKDDNVLLEISGRSRIKVNS